MRAGRATIQRDGNEERIAKAIRRVSAELNERAASGQINANQLPRSVRSVGVSGSDSMSSDGREGVSMRDDQAPSESFYGSQTVDDMSRDDGSLRGPFRASLRALLTSAGSDTGSNPEVASRWDEVRKSSAAAPSTWDDIRQKNARSSMGSESAPSAPRIRLEGELPDVGQTRKTSPYRSEDEGDEFGSTDRDVQRREFEKMMERERGGQDTSEGRWRGR